MSRDYNVFLKNADAIKSADFDFYAYSLGLQLRISPKVEDSSSFGFLQFNLRPEFMGIDLPTIRFCRASSFTVLPMMLGVTTRSLMRSCAEQLRRV